MTSEQEYDFKPYLKPWKEEKFVENLDEEIYHAEPALSAGQIKTIMDEDGGGVHILHAEKNGKIVRKETEALRFGRMLHKAVLEGPEFLKRYRVMPEFIGKTKDGRDSAQSGEAKAKRNAWLLDQPKDSIISESYAERDQLAGMMESLLKHPIAKILLTGGTREVSGFFNYEGFRCRIRIDLFQEALLMVNDLKSTKNARKKGFQWQIEDEMYFISAALYLIGAEKLTGKNQTFNFIAVEKTYPYLVSVHEVGISHVSAGEIFIKEGLRKLRTAIETDNWLPEPQIAFVAEASDRLMKRAQEMENLQ